MGEGSWMRKEGQVRYGGRQERSLESQKSDWKYAAAGVRGYGEFLESRKDLGCENLPGLNGEGLCQNPQ